MEEAQEQINLNIETDIQGYDIDAAVVHSARENARRAGVEELIHFQQRPVSELHHPKSMVLSSPIRRMESVWKKSRTSGTLPADRREL